MLKLQVLDWFFVVFHSSIIIFNMFGWIWPKTRKWNLFTLLLTAFSWFVLGIFFGIGYCFLTHWHWDVLSALSEYPPENSYVQYLIRRLTGIRISAELADILTLMIFIISMLLSGWLNVRDFLKRRKANIIKRDSKKSPFQPE
jgi:hypothetical protein